MSRAKPIELGDDDRGLVLLGQLHGGRQLRALLQRIVACAGLDLLEGLDQVIALGLGERRERGAAGPRGRCQAGPSCWAWKAGCRR